MESLNRFEIQCITEGLQITTNVVYRQKLV